MLNPFIWLASAVLWGSVGAAVLKALGVAFLGLSWLLIALPWMMFFAFLLGVAVVDAIDEDQSYPTEYDH